MRTILDTHSKILYLIPHCCSSTYFHNRTEIFKDTWLEKTGEKHRVYLREYDISDYTSIMVVRDPYARFLSWYRRFNKFKDTKNMSVPALLNKYMRDAHLDNHTELQKNLYEYIFSEINLSRAKEHKFLHVKDLWIWFDDIPHAQSNISGTNLTDPSHFEMLKDFLEPDYEWLDSLEYIYNFSNTRIRRLKYYKYDYAHEIFNKNSLIKPVSYRLH